MQKTLDNIFDEDDRFKGYFDPFRQSDHEFYSILFDEDGDLKCGVDRELEIFVKSNDLPWDSDAVALIYADRFAMGTKGNYSAIYMWR